MGKSLNHLGGVGGKRSFVATDKDEKSYNRSVPLLKSPLPLRERVRERVQIGWGTERLQKIIDV